MRHTTIDPGSREQTPDTGALSAVEGGRGAAAGTHLTQKKNQSRKTDRNSHPRQAGPELTVGLRH